MDFAFMCLSAALFVVTVLWMLSERKY